MRLNAVSGLFEENFQIRFAIVDIIPWRSSNSAPNASVLAKDLEKDVQRGGAEIVLGFSGQAPRTTREKGGATPFSSTALVQNPKHATERENLVAIAHELGHAFGAWHVNDRRSVMYYRATTLAFDEHTAKLIQLMRNFDFRLGVSSIDEATAATISSLFEENHSAGELNTLSIGYNNWGSDLISQGAYEKAVKAFHKAIDIDPKNTTAHYNLPSAYNHLGLGFTKRGNYQEAVDAFRQALRIDPKSSVSKSNLAVGYNNLGLHLAKQGEYEKAIAALREAHSLKPKDAEVQKSLTFAYNALGVVLVRSGQYEEAIANLQEALRLNPDDAETRSNLMSIYNYHGTELVKRGRYKEAIAALRQALHFDSKNTFARDALAVAYNSFITELGRGGKHQEAWKVVREAKRSGVKVSPQTLATLEDKTPKP
jgi:pentatricopeptide repeat protein